MEHFLAKNLPFWNMLNEHQQEMLIKNTTMNKLPKGAAMFYDAQNCSGVQLVKLGQVRVFIASPNGGQITLYRLVENDICVMSAACMIQNIDFEIHVEVEKDSEIYLIPKITYTKISNECHAVKDFTLELVSSRFSDVMWVVNHLVFSGMGKRLALTLLEHSQIEKSNILTLTHDDIAKDLGTAREVVSRLLKQFQLDGIVKLSRGKIEILDSEKLGRI